MINLEHRKKSSEWFEQLRNSICEHFELLEANYGSSKNSFQRKKWERKGGGGGEISIMKGDLFEKVGVNISTVFGQFSDKFAKEMPGADKSEGEFWASGISLVAHMKSPFIPAIHMNTRFITTSKSWFGGGIDLTPTFPIDSDTQFFHDELRGVCDKFGDNYYEKFKENCDEYFFLPHRNETRGVGGIFYDYLDTNNWEQDFAFTQEIGKILPKIFTKIIKNNVKRTWNEEDKEKQLVKRGRYAEFNLVYDRGTRFGLMTDGNIEAILMSMPPLVKWN